MMEKNKNKTSIECVQSYWETIFHSTSIALYIYKNCGDLFKAYDQEVKDEDSWRLWLGSMSLLTAHSMTN